MATTAGAATTTFVGISAPISGKTPPRSHVSDLVLVAFLLVQCLDGVFTYVGVSIFGFGIEANPIIVSLMTHLGLGPGVLSAKMLAVCLGIWLHLRQIHTAVALLTGFYVAAAIAPWMLILFL
jgi:hypothetical protein